MEPDQTAPLGLHCLTKRLLKHSNRCKKQTTFVVIGALRADYIKYIYRPSVKSAYQKIIFLFLN